MDWTVLEALKCSRTPGCRGKVYASGSPAPNTKCNKTQEWWNSVELGQWDRNLTERRAVFHLLKVVMHFILDHSHSLKDGQIGDPKASQAADQRVFSSSASPTPSDTHPTPTGASFLLAENLRLCKFADLGEEVSPIPLQPPPPHCSDQ